MPRSTATSKATKVTNPSQIATGIPSQELAHIEVNVAIMPRGRLCDASGIDKTDRSGT